MNDNSISLHLSRDEALVLLEWVATLENRPAESLFDDAEQKVLWVVEGQLESALVEVLSIDYHLLITEAKHRIMQSND
jgi:hypothetical protein